jgi:hypothetical protein
MFLNAIALLVVVTAADKVSKFSYFFKAYGPGSSVGIATGYGLNGPGIESR